MCFHGWFSVKMYHRRCVFDHLFSRLQIQKRIENSTKYVTVDNNANLAGVTGDWILDLASGLQYVFCRGTKLIYCEVRVTMIYIYSASFVPYMVLLYSIRFYIITKSMRALWLVNQLWVIVTINPRKNRASSELLYKSNRPQVSMVYKLINHLGCW